MDFLCYMDVRASEKTSERARLYRNNKGRLVAIGTAIDLFDLLHWIEKNPLAQFRQITKEDAVKADLNPPADKYEPHHLFAHHFDKDGNVL